MRPLCQRLQRCGFNGDERTDHPRRHVGTHDLCVRCVKSYSIVVLTGTDAQIPPRRHVGTHDLCVRCVKGYSVVVLTGTDALRLGTPVRPHRVSSRLVASVVAVGCYNNLESVTYRYGAVSGKSDFHVDILKYPGGEFLFPR